MLCKLNIRNYAIISELGIGFQSGLNIITGETGAGKSILMGALSLILGERADSSMLPDREKKCVIEGVFDMKNRNDIILFLKEEDLDQADELIIRREITPAGKSRAFINDTPVTLEQLRSLSGLMVDLHRQFDTLEIGKVDFQRSVLDALAENSQYLSAYTESFSKWQQLLRKLNKIRDEQNQSNRDFEYHQFLYNELEELKLQPDELEKAEAELKLLSQSEQLQAALEGACFGLSESEQPMVQQLKIMLQQLQGFVQVYPPLEELVARLQVTQVELQDVAGEFEHLRAKVKQDPERLLWLNERLAAGYKLQKKHGVKDTAGLLQLQATLSEKLLTVSRNVELIEQLEKEATIIEQEVLRKGEVLTQRRMSAAEPFSNEVNQLLHQVGMPNARIKAAVSTDIPGEHGLDQVDFLFDANKSGRFEPIRKVASGGELSRLMLCMKSLVASSLDMPTLIFDEIDSGISGEAARQVGVILKALAAKRQILCITHQPQIAGKADAHFYVYKQIENDVVKTSIRLLSTEERINAVAQMLSGEKPTSAALENAREMIMN